MWAKGENITPSTVMVNNEQMKSSPKIKWKGDYGPLPKNKYNNPGQYSVCLLDTNLE
jgi:hypothetical protein